MIEVRLNFKSVEEAIVALARMNGDDVKPKKAAPPVLQSPNKDVTAPAAAMAAPPTQAPLSPVAPAGGQQPGVVAPDPTKRPRKPRSDAGQERGPYKPRAQDAGAPATPTAVAEATASVGSPPVIAPAAPAPEGAVIATEADAQAALEGIFKGRGLPAAQKVLADFGISRLRDLPAEKRAGFIAAAKVAAVAG